MLIDCPACARSYHVSRGDIGAEGRVVICPLCEAQWFVEGEDSQGTIASVRDIRTVSISRKPGAEEAGRRSEAKSPWRHVRPIAAIAACVTISMGLLGAREHIVRMAPRAGGLYAGIGLPVNVRGLEIVALAPTRAEQASSDVTIAGEIRNVANKRVGVPRLTYEIRDGGGIALVTWTERAGARTLGTGKSLPFVSAPHHVPPGASSVVVRFEDGEATPLKVARRS